MQCHSDATLQMSVSDSRALASNLASIRESLASVLCHTCECKGVNCMVCGSEITHVSKSASVSKIAGSIASASKSRVRGILIIRSFAITTCQASLLKKFVVLRVCEFHYEEMDEECSELESKKVE